MRGLRIAALLGAGIAAVSVSVASVRPWRRKGERVTEDRAIPDLGEFTIWPPPSADLSRGVPAPPGRGRRRAPRVSEAGEPVVSPYRAREA